MSVSQTEAVHPGLMRRLASLTYDSMLVFAVLMAATALLLPITGGEAVDGLGPASFLYQAYLLLVVFGFFAMCWTHGGQTLGMRAWRVRLVQVDGSPVQLREAAMRYAAALLTWIPLALILLWAHRNSLGGLAAVPVIGVFAWSLGSRERLAWHDRLAGTRLIVIPKGR